MKDLTDYSLLPHNTFGIDVRCKRFVEFATVGELEAVLRSLTDDDNPLLLLGGGSNLLLTSDFSGTVIHSAIKGIEVVGETSQHVSLRVGSGETFDDVVAYCVEKGYYGIENLSKIPGEVGASAVQNIGAYGVEVKDLIEWVDALEVKTGLPVSFSNADCQYGYRQSRFKQDWKDRFVITHVTYRLSKQFAPYLDYGNIRGALAERGIDNPTATELRKVIIDIRDAKLPDPKVQGNAGSFFMNPIVPKEKYVELAALYPDMPHYYVDEQHEKIPAGWMIDQCGWKGRALGRAGVHGKQALVLVNRGGATGNDIVNLCEAIRKDVFERFGIEINPEVNVIQGVQEIKEFRSSDNSSLFQDANV
ncbi:MAG: UDP-N-acetylmuramate dehydrogenase [Prevotella sp.]|nr:UDP-N-acetylmuramate dehydrogenase [Prevotella sp.]